MFNKTSSVDFLKYGEVFSIFSENNEIHDNNYIFTIQNDKIVYFYVANTDIYLKSTEGICMLVVANSLDQETFDRFVIHRVVKINQGVLFNFISLGNEAKVEIAFSRTTVLQNRFIPNPYGYSRIKPAVRINELIAYYYNVRSSNYFFPGEKDQYWEITFVDRGTLHTTIEDHKYQLTSNQMILYAPGQFHRQNTTNEACSYLTIIIDLETNLDNQKKLVNTVFEIDRDSRAAIETFVKSNDQKSAYDRDLMIIALEKIIINLLKKGEKSLSKVASTPMQQRFENELLNEILLYINENIYTAFNIEELCAQFGISRSSLQSLFRNNLSIAPKEYVSSLKLEKSKLLIKESKFTISEIATMLGFSTIHYFSRRFKQEFGLTPTEYANKIL